MNGLVVYRCRAECTRAHARCNDEHCTYSLRMSFSCIRLLVFVALICVGENEHFFIHYIYSLFIMPNTYTNNETQSTRSRAVAKIADRTALQHAFFVEGGGGRNRYIGRTGVCGGRRLYRWIVFTFRDIAI